MLLFTSSKSNTNTSNKLINSTSEKTAKRSQSSEGKYIDPNKVHFDKEAFRGLFGRLPETELNQINKAVNPIKANQLKNEPNLPIVTNNLPNLLKLKT